MQSRIYLFRISILFIVIFFYFFPLFIKSQNNSLSQDIQSSCLNSNDTNTESYSSTIKLLSVHDSHLGQRGNYWVFYNYVRGEKVLGDFESVTYSTHSDFTFLDNLEPLLERWMGPVSISLYSPGSDFNETTRRIAFLRECSQSSLVKDYVTFHLFFDSGQFPSQVLPELSPVDCAAAPTFGAEVQTYRKSKNLTYPINVARNVAREMSTTHFVLASDIELYPSPNLVHQFLDMIQMDDFKILKKSQNPKVFVLPIFEVEKNITHLPQDKAELQGMLKSNLAVPFHKFVCSLCHKIPRQDEWIKAKQEHKLGIQRVNQAILLKLDTNFT